MACSTAAIPRIARSGSERTSVVRQKPEVKSRRLCQPCSSISVSQLLRSCYDSLRLRSHENSLETRIAAQRILRIFDGISLPSDERKNRAPVNPAKLCHCFARFLFIAGGVCRGKNEAPTGCGKHTRSAQNARRCCRIHEGQGDDYCVLLQA